MASLDDRLRFPDDRIAFIFQGAYLPILTPPITTITVFEDSAATTLADILDPTGNPIPNSVLHTDTDGLLPEFYGPVGNVTRVWAVVPGASGTPSPLDAQTGGLLAALGGAGTVTQVAGVNPDEHGHVPLTATDVGADPTGSASTAQTNAETFATGAVATETTRAEAAESTLTSSVAAKYTKPSLGIPATDLTSAVQTDLSLAASAYQKPGPGIPSTDLTTGVQTSLGLANSALQSAPVPTVFGRSGAVVAQTGDYTAAQVGADASGAATTAQTNAETFATNAVSTETTRAQAAEALLAPKASPTFTGAPAAPTATPLTNTTRLATTAYTDAAVAVETTRAQGAESTLTSSVAAKYTKPGTGIPATDLTTAVQTELTSASTAYQKPGTGIPSSDMTAAVQTSLGKADTALQPGSGGTVNSVTAKDATVVTGGTSTDPTIGVGVVQTGNLAAGIQTSLDLANTALQSAPVTSFNSRTGAIAPASGDYAVGQVTGAAPLASPTFTGTPAAPTASALTNTTQVATTAYSDAAVAVEKSRAQTAEGLAAAKANNLSDLGNTATARGNLGAAPLASPTFTGIPAAPTATALTNTTQIATTAYADAAVAIERSRAQTAEGLLAPLASPAFTGIPTVPTAGALTNTTQAASTAYTDTAVGVEKTRALAAEALLAPLASPALTGSPTAPTKSALTNSTALATTAYADSAVGVETTRALAAEAGREIVAPPAVLTRGRATVITTYASGHGWTASGFASSNVNDTADGRLSGQMLTGTTTGNAGNFPTFTKTGAPALNINGNCVRVWIKVDIPTNITAITLRVADTGGLAASRYISWSALASSGGVYRTNGVIIPPNTWTELSFSLGSAFTSGTPNLAALTEYRWIVQDNGTACTAHFGGIEVFSALGERYPNGVVCLGFDDCWAGQYNLALNVLSAYGYAATIFPIIDQIGQSGSWTLAQLQQMVNIGWEVAPHASTLSNHSNWNTLTNAQQTADVLASQAWIAGQGFGLSGAYAYPLGGFNGGADTAVAPLVQVARTIDSTLLTETLPVGSPLHMRSAAGVGGTGGIGVTTYTTASTGVLALAKAAGALVPITFHDISSGTSGNINQCSIADFTTLVAAIASAGMAVATYAELLHYALSALVSPTFYEYQVINLPTDLAAKAPLASPALTGVPTSTTAASGTNSTQVATTAYTDAAVLVEKTRALAAETLLAPLASPAFTTTASILGNYAKVGPTAYTFTVPSVSGAYLVLDKSILGSDASVVFRDVGAAKGEVGLATDDNMHLKVATGSAGSESYVDAIVLMNTTAYVYVPTRLGIGTSTPGNSMHVAASSSAGRAGIKIENTANVSGNSNSTLVELKGNSPTAAVDWLFGTDFGINGGNNWFVQDSNNGLRLFIDSTGRVVLGDSTAGPAAANSLDVVGSIKTRGTNSLTPLNICGRSTAFGAPTTGTWQVNDAIMDVSGDWYYCTGAGTPGTWRSLSMGGSTVRQNGLAAMNIDLLLASDSAVFLAGTIYYTSLYVENPLASVGHIYCRMTGAGVTLTNTYLGVYDVLTGSRLGISADVSSTFTGATGLLSIALTSPITTLTWNQQLYVAMLSGSAGTMPTIITSMNTTSNVGQSSNYRLQKTSTTSNTSLPSTAASIIAATTGKMPVFALGA